MASRDEIQSTVENIVPQRLSLSRSGGRVDQAQAFTELRDITMTTLALDPNVILRLIEVARDKTLDAVIKEYELALQIRDALTAISTGPNVAPFRTSDPLANASSALSGLQANIGNGFVSSDSLNRAKVNLDLFLANQISPNVRDGAGNEITTKEEAVRLLRTMTGPLRLDHAETLRLVVQLEQIFEEYDDADLRVTVGRTVVDKSKGLVAELQQNVEFSPVSAAMDSKTSLLNILTIKRLLTTYFESSGPLDTRLEGIPANSFRASPVGDGNAAQLEGSSIVRPLVTIESGASVFDVTANGTPTSLDLLTLGVQSFPASMHGSASGPFDTTAGNNIFKVTFDQGSEVTVTLTVGAAVPIATVISEINTAVGFTVAFLDTYNGISVIKLQSTTNGRNSHVLIGTTGTATAIIGFSPGALESGVDPLLSSAARALTLNQSEYTALEVEDIIPTTDLVTSTTGVFANNILTDGSVASFLAAGVEGGDSILISSGPNAGRQLAVLRVVALQIHLGGSVDDTAISYIIRRDNKRLQLTSTEVGTSSSLDIDAGDVNTRLGFTGAETARGTTEFIAINQLTPAPSKRIDSSLFSVVAGDQLTLELSPAQLFSIVSVESDSNGDPILRITPAVEHGFSDVEFSIESQGALSFQAFIGSPIVPSNPLPSFLDSSLPIHGYNQNLSQLEVAIAAAINDFTKAPAAIALVEDLIDLLDNISGLQFILAIYDAAEVSSLDLLLASLEEHQFDRFLKLLMEGFITDALAVTKDDFSFASQLQSAARDLNAEALNV
jgi:hypothetical protein